MFKKRIFLKILTALVLILLGAVLALLTLWGVYGFSIEWISVMWVKHHTIFINEIVFATYLIDAFVMFPIYINASKKIDKLA